MVRMNEFGRESEELVNAEARACERVLRSGWWILGQAVREFEQAWAGYLGVSNAVGCANGLDAIEICLRALQIKPGDEVITTSMTAFATVLGIIRAGATPVLADIDGKTGILSHESVKRCLSARTRAIILVHLYGQLGPVEELLELTRESGIHLIEDCAQAHGAQLGTRSAGTFGDVSAWSFYPTKNLGAVGDAGAVTTSNRDVAEVARVLRNYGQTERYHHPLVGMNSRLDEVQAAILCERLKYLPSWIKRRRAIAGRYLAEISNADVALMDAPREVERHAYHLFVVRCCQRRELQAHLKSEGIESLIHYPVPIHHQDPCRNVERDPQGLHATELHANTCLSLPCHPGLTDSEIDQVVSAINKFKV